MGTGKPSSAPPLFPQLAKVEAAISGLVDRLDGRGMPLSSLESATRSIVRLQKIRDGLRSEVVAVPLSPVQLAALALLVQATAAPLRKLEEAAANGDKIGRHAGQGARWTGYLLAVNAIRAGRLSDPTIRAAVSVHRAPSSITSFLRAAGEVVNGK
jgi:hypothetical protein